MRTSTRCAVRGPMGEIFATLVNTGLNVLRLEGWFPARLSMPLRAKTCAFRPTQTIARLYGRASLTLQSSCIEVKGNGNLTGKGVESS